MNKKAGTRDLNDDEFTDEVINIGSDEDEPQRAGTPKVSVKTETQEPTLTARDDEHTAQTLQTTQLVSTSNQLQDAHMTINSLHDQLLQCECERANAEHRADRLEMQLEMARLVKKGPDCRLMPQMP
ncbi:hypothetical protein C8R48DRAFT_672286 [Suillus tomentosus]|nr:hypothetical protein C8R48DRAFT_672286 [Suillus tomentosus]